MSRLQPNEECELCLGSGVVPGDVRVIGQNDDGSDILEYGLDSICRCVEEIEDDEDSPEYELMDDEDEY